MSAPRGKIGGTTDNPAETPAPEPGGLLDGYGPFAYLNAPNAPTYRRVVRALMVEKERFTVHVRPEQVYQALAADGEHPVEETTVAEALERPAQPGWGNLLAFPDASRVTALEDFYRRRMLYQISRQGEAAERKEQLIEYLERFIHDLLTRGASIAELLGTIPAGGVEFLAATAADREAADAAPGEADTARARVRHTWLRQWSSLTEGFVSTPARESESKLLRARARAAISALLAVVRALHERTGGRTDRAQDFLTLARWFATLPADADRHRLWRSAFGLAPVLFHNSLE